MNNNSNTRILIVDDEPLIRNSLKALLSINDFNVETCAAGSAAAELATRFQPNVVVIDWMLGKFARQEENGLLVANKLRQILPEARIIIASGDSNVRSMVADEFEFLAKPFHLDELLEMLPESNGEAPSC